MNHLMTLKLALIHLLGPQHDRNINPVPELIVPYRLHQLFRSCFLISAIIS